MCIVLEWVHFFFNSNSVRFNFVNLLNKKFRIILLLAFYILIPYITVFFIFFINIKLDFNYIIILLNMIFIFCPYNHIENNFIFI